MDKDLLGVEGTACARFLEIQHSQPKPTFLFSSSEAMPRLLAEMSGLD
jgi:hypothetical protein